jgi:acyl transferase domain-containing protein
MGLEDISRQRPWQLLTLSAHTEHALDTITKNLMLYLKQHPHLPLADVAYTLQMDHSALDYRRILVACANGETIQFWEPTCKVPTGSGCQRPVAMLFPGLGEQYVGMARDLYQYEYCFRETVDRCAIFLERHIGTDLRKALSLEEIGVRTADGVAQLNLQALVRRKPGSPPSSAEMQLKQTSLAQPAIFVIEYSLAKLLMYWGVQPQAMMGYSLGEYVAACLAGVFSLEDALTVVAQRAQLIKELPAGAMLTVALSPEEIQPYLNEEVGLAVVNGRLASVVAGSVAVIERVQVQLDQHGIVARRVATSHAFHSPMLAAAKEPLTRLISGLQLQAPKIPYISNLTGSWITEEQALDPAYWAEHMCQTVQFARGIEHLVRDGEKLVLEVGPGQSLGSFVKLHPACSRRQMALVMGTLSAASQSHAACVEILATLGHLWIAGVNPNWRTLYDNEPKKVSLPPHLFDASFQIQS